MKFHDYIFTNLSIYTNFIHNVTRSTYIFSLYSYQQSYKIVSTIKKKLKYYPYNLSIDEYTIQYLTYYK